MRWAPLLLLTGCARPDSDRPADEPLPGIASFESEAFAGRPNQRGFSWALDGDAVATLDCVSDQPDDHHRWRGPSPVVLHGLLGDTEYACELTLPRDSAALAFRTEPSEIDDWVMEGDPLGVPGHYTLLNQFVDHGAIGHHLAILDPRGRVRWTLALPDGLTVGVDATLVDPEHLLLGGGTGATPMLIDLEGNPVWSLTPAVGEERYHHDAELGPDGHVFTLRDEVQDAPGLEFLGLRIEEWDPLAQAVLWSWSSQGAVDAGELLPGPGDVWHSNALQRVEDADGVGMMVSQAKNARILRVDQASGAIAWQLGEGLDFALTTGEWFYGAHDPEWDGNRVVMHDNGRDRPEGAYSRVVEYEIDPVARTATQLWEYREPGWFEVLYGDADRLGDGQILVARGHCADCGPTVNPDLRSNVIALDPVGGSIAWKLQNPDPRVGIYRAERIDGCDLFDNRAYCPDAGD